MSDLIPQSARYALMLVAYLAAVGTKFFGVIPVRTWIQIQAGIWR